MNSTISTPSVDFNFVDAPDTHAESPPPLEESELSYGLSPTLPKKQIRFQGSPALTPLDTFQQRTGKNSLFREDEDCQEFFKQFSSKFKVTLSESSGSFGTAFSKKTEEKGEIKIVEQEDKQNQPQMFNRISLRSDNRSGDDRYEADFKTKREAEGKGEGESYRYKKKCGFHPLYCFKKKQSVKSKLMVFPTLQHAQSERITKKNNEDNSVELPMINLSNHSGFDYNLCHTSKATPRGSGVALRIFEKGQKKKAFSVKVNEDLGRSVSKLASKLAVEGTNKPIANLRSKKGLKKSHIFLNKMALIN